MNSIYNTAYFQGFFQAYGRDKEAQTAVPPEHVIKNPGSDAAGSFGGSSTSAPVPPPEIPLRDRQQNWDDRQYAASQGVWEAQQDINKAPRRPTDTLLDWESPYMKTVVDAVAPEQHKQVLRQEFAPPQGIRQNLINNIYEAGRGQGQEPGRLGRMFADRYKKDLYGMNRSFRDTVHTRAEEQLKAWGKDFARKAAPAAIGTAAVGIPLAMMAMGGKNKSTAGVPSSTPGAPYSRHTNSSLMDWFSQNLGKDRRTGVSPDRPRVTPTWAPMDTYRRSDG